jgi:hypothetical protein
LVADDGVDAVQSTLTRGLMAGMAHPHLDLGERPRFSNGQNSEQADRTGDSLTDPMPLVRQPSPAPEFPVSALGDLACGAAMAIHELTGAPVAMCATSVLAAMSLATQAHADVELAHGNTISLLSLFFLVIALSGERKSTVDKLANKPVRDRERELREAHKAAMADYENSLAALDAARKDILKKTAGQGADAVKAELDKLGVAPSPPPGSFLTCGEPTVEGLTKSLIHGQPSQGVFTSEGGEFIGGHALKDDAKLRSASMLSKCWDGEPIKRVRSGDGATYLSGRRIAMFLMVQPDVAATLCGDRVLLDQGLLFRFLPTAPASTMGTRLTAQLTPARENDLGQYYARMGVLLHLTPRLKPGTTNELDPRVLRLTEEARAMARAFADSIEAQLVPHGDLRPVAGFAAKLGEQATRIAGVLTIFDNPHAERIGVEHVERGIRIAQFYAQEALRLYGTARVDRDIDDAERLRIWLFERWPGKTVTIRGLVRLGPNSLRDTKRIKQLVNILVEHRWLLPDANGYRIARGVE